MMIESSVYLPGDQIESDLIPTSQKRKIQHGIDVTQIRTSSNQQQRQQSQPPSENTNEIYTATQAGKLNTDFRKKTASIYTPTARYEPTPGDLVIAQIRSSTQDHFYCNISSFSQLVLLGHLSFEGASKKTRPMLKPGDLVYAKVISVGRGIEAEISCVNPATGKGTAEGLGEMKGGMVWDVSIGFADRLMTKNKDNINAAGTNVMEELGGKIPGGFEVCVGRNGRVWVDCPEAGARGCIAVGRCLREADEAGLSAKEVKRFVANLCSELGL